jgi:hypothetical protein
MSANPEHHGGLMDSFPGDDERGDHAAEPWRAEGRYIRDAFGGIVVRGRSAADARRIVAAINGVRGIPTEVLESWKVEDVSNPATRPDFELELGDDARSPHEVRPPGMAAREELSFPLSPPAFPIEKPYPYDRRVGQRRMAERRQKDRRAAT